jgi:hypothetical protein
MLEMLKPPAWSPPVPTMSIARGAKDSTPGLMASARKARANPAISPGVSPLSARAVRNAAFGSSGTSGEPRAAAAACTSSAVRSWRRFNRAVSSVRAAMVVRAESKDRTPQSIKLDTLR